MAILLISFGHRFVGGDGPDDDHRIGFQDLVGHEDVFARGGPSEDGWSATGAADGRPVRWVVQDLLDLIDREPVGRDVLDIPPGVILVIPGDQVEVDHVWSGGNRTTVEF
jgi:hypothetical protein